VVRPAGQQPLHRIRPGRGGEVEILAPPAEQNVPDGTAYQGDLVAGLVEPGPEFVHHRRDLQERLDASPLDGGQRSGGG
jgi:hypothetical protein